MKKKGTRRSELTARQWAIAAGGTLFALGLLAFISSAQLESESRYSYAKQGGKVVGVKISEYKMPNRNRDLLTAFGVIAWGLTGCLPFVRLDKKGDYLIDPETLGQDTVATAAVVSENVLHVGGAIVAGSISWARVTGKNTLIPLALSVSPPGFQAVYDRIAQINWFGDYLKEKRHYWLIGETGGGKTTLLRRLVYEVLTLCNEGVYKNARLLIMDPNYGAPDEHGKINDWFGLPRTQYIRVRDEEILAATEGLYQEFSERRDAFENLATAISEGSDPAEIRRLQQQCDDYGLFFFVVEEWVALAERLGEKWVKRMVEILVQCRKYRMKACIVTQMIHSKYTGIGLGMRMQFAKLMLGKTCEDSLQVKELLKGGADVDEEIAKLMGMRRQHPYACFVQYGNYSSAVIRVIPKDLQDMDRVRVMGPWLTAEQRWWQEIYVANQANQKWLQEQVALVVAGQAPSLLSSSNPLLKERFGVKAANSDKRYTDYVKPAILDLTERAKKTALSTVS